MSPLTTGVDITSDFATPINPDSLDVRASKYYWNPIKKTFPNLFGTNPELNLERLYELDTKVQQGGEQVFYTQPIITREQALAASSPNAPIPSIIPRLGRQLPKGSTLSDWDLLGQQQFYGVELRRNHTLSKLLKHNKLLPFKLTFFIEHQLNVVPLVMGSTLVLVLLKIEQVFKLLLRHLVLILLTLRPLLITKLLVH